MFDSCAPIYTNIPVRCTSEIHYKHFSTNVAVLRTLLIFSIQLNSKLFAGIYGSLNAAELQNICRNTFEKQISRCRAP
jgi:hypothetical protein